MDRRDLRKRVLATVFVGMVGAVIGAAAAVLLNALGDYLIALRHPQGTLSYHWKAGAFAIAGSVITPILAWTTLRRAPVWRVAAEPAAAAVLVTVVGAAFVPALIAWVPVVAIGAIVRLSVATSESRVRIGSPAVAEGVRRPL